MYNWKTTFALKFSPVSRSLNLFKKRNQTTQKDVKRLGREDISVKELSWKTWNKLMHLADVDKLLC